jgi:hypothetical protein
MGEAPQENAITPAHHSREGVRLIRGLRWIGLEEEARGLELAISTVPSEQRASVLAGPLGTD